MKPWNEDLIPIETARTLDGLFVQRVRRSGDDVAYRSHDRAADKWRDYTWNQMAAEVARWQDALEQEGLKPGDRVALILRNCPEWVVFDQAAMGLGLVVVPLYTDDRPDNIAYILEDAGVRLLLVQDAGRWRRLREVVGDGSPLERVVVLDIGHSCNLLHEEDPRVRCMDTWLPAAGSALRKRHGDPHALASIVYTSGTTGRPKGVMLSHHNMLSVAHNGLTMVTVYREDQFLSFLPLSHTLERTGGYYLPMLTGSCVAYARSVAQLAQDLQEIRPTIMIAVPRVFERIYGRIKDQLAQGPKARAVLFNLAISVGWRRFENRQGRAEWSPALLLWPLLKRLVADKVAQRFGGRLRFAVSGGAPLSAEIAKVFIGLDIHLIQGYGLTETSPVISINLLEDNIPASVGVPLRGIEVKIGADSELLVKSPGVMLGYWNNHTATRKMIDADGWLHTGDQARIENNHIFITGRLKDILVLSNGEKIPPSDMEMAIILDSLFEQALIVGEGEPYLTALVVLNGDHWAGFAQGCGVDPMDPKSLHDPRVTGQILARIRAALKDFPGYAKIRRVTALLEPWTVDNGLLTPTMKVKRSKVLERHAERVRGMYESGPTGD